VSQAASQAAAFYKQSVEAGAVWTVRDDRGYPTPENPEGQRAQPFWSSRSRVERIVRHVPAYHGFEPVEIPLSAFLEHWLPDLQANNLHVGVNWSGTKAVGFDMEPAAVQRAVEAAMRFSTRPS
jgi:Protein of unknown function (DUF2750)